MKAIILARVSSKEQEENNSIPAQTRRLTEYADRQNLEIIEVVQLVESSTTANRVKFNELLGRIKRSKEVVALVTDTIDRLQRGFRESVVLDELRKAGKIELHFMRENLVINETSNSADILRWDMGVMFAKSYVTQLRDNVIRGQEQMLRNGEWFAKAPFGYRNTNRDGKKWIEPNENADFVRDIFTWYGSGMWSMKQIRERLKTVHGITMSASNVEKILKNPFYYGEMRSKGGIYAHHYIPIITRQQFDIARQSASRFSKQPYKYAGLPFLYRGIIRCGDCGCTVTPERAKGHVYYHCTQYKGKHGAAYIREEEITKQLENVYRQIHPNQQQYDEVMDALRKSHEDKITYKTTHTARLRAELTKIDTRIDRLYESYLDGDIEKDFYKKKNGEFKAERVLINNRLSSLDGANNEFYENATKVMELVRNGPLLFRKSSEPHEKRQLLNLVLQNLELHDRELRWKYKKPFDSMASYIELNSWYNLVDVFQEDSWQPNLIQFTAFNDI